MTYVFRELEVYVKCRTCKRVGRREGRAIAWYPKQAGRKLSADATRWKRSVFRSV